MHSILPSTHAFRASGNPFFHLSSQQFAAQYLMSSAPDTTSAASTTAFPTATPVGASSVNWVTAGKVTPIRNQQQCGSCWAFAATAVIESMYLIRVGGTSASSLALSPQQLVSCCNRANGCSYSSGCNGGGSEEVSRTIR